ncbi:hypothetical protein ABZP36_016592 [Zizania latifolia]
MIPDHEKLTHKNHEKKPKSFRCHMVTDTNLPAVRIRARLTETWCKYLEESSGIPQRTTPSSPMIAVAFAHRQPHKKPAPEMHSKAQRFIGEQKKLQGSKPPR